MPLVPIFKVFPVTVRTLAVSFPIITSSFIYTSELVVPEEDLKLPHQVEIAVEFQYVGKYKLANGGKHFDIKWLNTEEPDLSQREQDAIARDKQFLVDRKTDRKQARINRRDQRRTDRRARITARRETNQANWKKTWGRD